MPLITLSLHDRPEHSNVRLWPTSSGIPFPYATGSTPSHGSTPVRGLLYSILVHEVLLFSALFAQVYAGYFAEPAPPSELLFMMDIRNDTKLIYFPTVDNDTESTNDVVQEEHEPATAKKKSPQGMSYPGPQRIVSDSPRPTNRFQTLLQPAIENPAIIPPPIMLPNVILLADAAPLPKVEPPKPPVQPEAPPKPEIKPSLKLAKTDTSLLVAVNSVPTALPAKPARAILPASAPDLPAPPPEPKPVEPPPAPLPEQPKVARTAPAPIEGPDSENILSVTPLPAPPEAVLRVPNGEARGRVTISPEPNLAASTVSNATRVTAPSATPKDESSKETTKDVPAENGSVKPKAAENNAPGPARSAFPGMTITGGRVETGSAGNSGTSRTGTITLGSSNSANASAPTGSYGMTIVSTGNSGGGLPDFGVFLHERAYTVYLDMKQPNGASRPSWTLQYAVMPLNPQKTVVASTEGVIPPFPASKIQPELPAELAQKYDRRLIVVYAIINTEGKLQNITVKQSPDPQLNPPIVAALSKWVFRPAELNGEAVAVKALFGIPLSSP